jgi:hypothetical protein
MSCCRIRQLDSHYGGLSINDHEGGDKPAAEGEEKTEEEAEK